MRSLASRALALALFGLTAPALSASAQAWLGASTGTVETARLGEDHWRRAVRGLTPLADGTHVRTGTDGAATLVFADRSRVRLGPGSELILDELGAKASAVKLQSGSLEAFAEKGPAPSLRVRTATAFVAAQGAEFSAEVSALKDTQLVVFDGTAQVRLQNGETTELGEGKDHRSLLVMSGRPLRLLPHPREDAAAKTAAAAPTGEARSWPDCLHQSNGALRPLIEQVAECQRRARARLAKRGELTLADSADLRSHQQEELREYARARGWMPAGADGEAAEAETAETPAAAADGDELSKSLVELRATPQTGGDGPELQLPPQAQALLQQLQGGGSGGGGEVRIDPAMMNALFKALLGAPPAGTGGSKRKAAAGQ